MIRFCKSFVSLLLVLVIIVCSIPIGYAADEKYKNWKQGEEPWGSYVYGGGSTIASYGCMITALATLMAYADPDLRDSSKFNPEVCAREYFSFMGNSIIWEPLKGPLTHDGNYDQGSVEELCTNCKKYLDEGKFVLLWGTPDYGGSQSTSHYSAVVGWNDSEKHPIIVDAATGIDTWQNYVDGYTPGKWALNVYTSSKLSSTEAFSGNGAKTSTEEERNAPVVVNGQVVTEWELKGMSIPSGLVRDQDTGRLVPASAEDLELMYKLNMANIKESVDARNTSVEETVRVIVVVIGMILMVYGLLLVLAFFFDRFNTIIDISLLGVFTVGKMKPVEKDVPIDYEMKKAGYVTGVTLFVRVMAIELIGGLLVSGLMVRLVFKIIYSLM